MIEAPARRTYRYYDLIMAAFVTVLICSNFISAPKRVTLGGLTFGAGVLFFPISYLFGDILTEVYGYARSRKVVWAGFGALAFTTLVSWSVVTLPPDPSWPNQAAYVAVFGNSWRIVAASMVGFFVGELFNSFLMAKLKVATRGRFLWVRTIGSTVVGEAVDSLLFYPIAFFGVWDNASLLAVMVSNYVLKVLWEIVATPLTYAIVAYLKRAEGEDFYDVGTDFTPFSLQT